MIKVGAHVSAAVSLDLAFDKALEIGAECFQIFVSPPRQWAMTSHSVEEIQAFKDKATRTGIGPNFIHGTYLVNLGTSDPEHLRKSIEWLVYGLKSASELGMQGVIFHIGSHKGVGFEKILPQVVESLRVILSETKNIYPSTSSQDDKEGVQGDKFPYLILETSAGGGGTIGRDFREMGRILKQVQDDRLKVCIDVQHIFAGGYDVKSLVGLRDVIEEFKEEVGIENLAAIHANDSKMEMGSFRDRHENIGEGLIGREGFENLVNYPELQDIPFILEVPGFAGNGPDKENVEILKSLIKT